MAYQSEAELRDWASRSIERLRSANIEAQIDSVHDYLIKLSIVCDGQSFGKLKVYHKPTKGLFTMDFSEMRSAAAIIPIIQETISGVRTAADPPRKTAVPSPALPSTPAINTARVPANIPKLPDWHIYVDGSYLRGRIGYGAVILEDGELREALHGVVTDPESKSVRQVAGELMATMKALEWCAQHGIAAVHVHHDYTGIAFWATGAWKANTSVTQAYVAFMRGQSVQVNWHKVDAHTGDYWNEYVDHLAGGEIPGR